MQHLGEVAMQTPNCAEQVAADFLADYAADTWQGPWQGPQWHKAAWEEALLRDPEDKITSRADNREQTGY